MCEVSTRITLESAADEDTDADMTVIAGRLTNRGASVRVQGGVFTLREFPHATHHTLIITGKADDVTQDKDGDGTTTLHTDRMRKLTSGARTNHHEGARHCHALPRSEP